MCDPEYRQPGGGRRMSDTPVKGGKFETASVSGTDQVSVELSSRRTGMSFQRTRLSADRTLMSVIRTSLSLIAFGFTIFQFLGKLRETQPVSASPRNFGMAMVSLGIAVLIIGIVYHGQFMLGMRTERHEMTKAGLIHGESNFPVSFTLIAAVLLLGIGIMAIVSMVFDIGPFD
jgi:putative membrane protein